MGWFGISALAGDRLFSSDGGVQVRPALKEPRSLGKKKGGGYLPTAPKQFLDLPYTTEGAMGVCVRCVLYPRPSSVISSVIRIQGGGDAGGVPMHQPYFRFESFRIGCCRIPWRPHEISECSHFRAVRRIAEL